MQSFFALIDRLNAVQAEERQAVKDQVWDTFGVEKAVLCLDMSQFSLTVRRSGIVSYLRRIRHMQVAAEPVVRESRGTIVKAQADNLMAVFDHAADAVQAAVNLNRALDAIPVSVGIDYGRFLLVPGQDCFGDPVNVAFKLGEDLARPGEILITQAVRERLGAECGYRVLEQRASISGLEIVACTVQYA